MEVLVFYKDFCVVRSGLQSFSFKAESSGFRWLTKALFSSLPSMGFIPETLPYNGFTPLGSPIQKGLYCRADASASAGLGLSCKVFRAEFGPAQHPVAVKIGASAQREVRELPSCKAVHVRFVSSRLARCYIVGAKGLHCFCVVP